MVYGKLARLGVGVELKIGAVSALLGAASHHRETNKFVPPVCVSLARASGAVSSLQAQACLFRRRKLVESL